VPSRTTDSGLTSGGQAITLYPITSTAIVPAFTQESAQKEGQIWKRSAAVARSYLL